MYKLQLLLNIAELFTSLSKINFYFSMFKNLGLSSIPEFPSFSPSRKGYSLLPSYWTFRLFINEFSHDYLTSIFQNQVNILKNMGIISGEFISMDSTTIKANTKLNNPKYLSD